MLLRLRSCAAVRRCVLLCDALQLLQDVSGDIIESREEACFSLRRIAEITMLFISVMLRSSGLQCKSPRRVAAQSAHGTNHLAESNLPAQSQPSKILVQGCCNVEFEASAIKGDTSI